MAAGSQLQYGLADDAVESVIGVLMDESLLVTDGLRDVGMTVKLLKHLIRMASPARLAKVGRVNVHGERFIDACRFATDVRKHLSMVLVLKAMVRCVRNRFEKYTFPQFRKY